MIFEKKKQRGCQEMDVLSNNSVMYSILPCDDTEVSWLMSNVLN